MDTFVRSLVFPQWECVVSPGYDPAAREQRKNQVLNWAEMVGEDIFGHSDYVIHSRLLLFFLLPGFPILPKGDLDQLHQLAEGDRQGPDPISVNNRLNEIGSLPVIADWWERRLIWAIVEVG